MGLEWHGGVIELQLQNATLVGCQEAAEHLKGAMQMKVSEMYPPASAPGQPPHSRSGELQEGFVVVPVDEGDKKGSAVENAVPHAIYLEVGTRNMAPRPFFMSTTLEELGPLGVIAAEGAAAAAASGISPVYIPDYGRSSKP